LTGKAASTGKAAGYLRLLRPAHWIKNGFVFAPLVYSLSVPRPGPLLAVLLAFVSFCLAASASYVLNDLLDHRTDREHPRKRHRPIASGAVSVRGAAAAAALLIAAGSAVAAVSGLPVLIVVLVYFLWNLLYSTYLKKMVILDVLAIAGGFLLRVIAGAAAAGVAISQWMLLVTFFLALFLGFSKRRTELHVLEGNTTHRSVLERYSPSLLNALMVSTASLTIVTYSLYVAAPQTAERLTTGWLIYTVPLVVFGLFRYLYVVHERVNGDDIVDILVHDLPILLDILLWGAATIVILYGGWA